MKLLLLALAAWLALSSQIWAQAAVQATIIDSTRTPFGTSTNPLYFTCTGCGGGSGGVTVHGTPTVGNCVEWYAAAIIEDAGAACGGSGSGITALTGDGTASGSGSVALTVTKSGGVAFGSAAFVATSSFDSAGAASSALSSAESYSANASNIASGTVGAARLSGSYTGITGVGTLSAGSIPAGLVTGLATTATTLGLLPANNLSDLASASSARTNLGLGTAATQASSAFDAAGAASSALSSAEAYSANASNITSGSLAAARLASGAAASNLGFTPPSVSGTPTAGDCASWASASSLQDAGAACGSGSGASGANPTGTVGLTVVNGSATTFMRSDAAPALGAQGANTLIANMTGSTATPTYAALPSCSGAGAHLIYTSGTGLACKTPASPVALTPSNPASSTSTSLVMAGIGGTATITPAETGRIRVTVNGDAYTLTGNATVKVGLYGGTGTAPSNGAAASGYTAIGNPVSATTSYHAAGQGFPFSLSWIVTGLTLSTAYWVDLGFDTTNASDSANLENLSVTIMEF